MEMFQHTGNLVPQLSDQVWVVTSPQEHGRDWKLQGSIMCTCE